MTIGTQTSQYSQTIPIDCSKTPWVKKPTTEFNPIMITVVGVLIFSLIPKASVKMINVKVSIPDPVLAAKIPPMKPMPMNKARRDQLLITS